MTTQRVPVLTGARSIALGLSQRQRLLVGNVCGLLAGIVVSRFAPWQMAMLSAWDMTAIVILALIWLFIPALDGEMTRSTARREDVSRTNDDFVVLFASAISLVGVVLTLFAAKNMSGGMKAWMTSVAVATVAISWFTVNTVYALRYAHLYFDELEGGIDFNEEACPDYLDFVYLAFTVGMTFQVSDNDISSKAIRRAITRHALLGYLFGTVIIGVTINVVGGLIQ